jgi:hypothetical protein
MSPSGSPKRRIVADTTLRITKTTANTQRARGKRSGNGEPPKSHDIACCAPSTTRNSSSEKKIPARQTNRER